MPDRPDSTDSHDEAPEHLPGLEPDDPAGLDPVESVTDGGAESPAARPGAEATPSNAPAEAAAERWGTGKWTNAELDSWYEAYGGDEQYFRDLNAGRIPRELYSDFGERYEAMEVETNTAGADAQDAEASKLFLSVGSQFSRLQPDSKAWLREVVEGLNAPPPPEGERGPSPDQQLRRVSMTLPDGSEVMVEFDDQTGMRRIVDDDGSAGEWEQIETIPDPPSPTKDVPSTEPSSEASSGLIGGLPRGLVFGGGGIFALAMVGLFFVFSGGGGGGGGASGPWSVTDPQNDFVPAFSDKDAIENPSAAGDVTGLDVAVDGGDTTVTVTFAGAAEGLMTEGGEELAAALQFIPVGDDRWIDILFDEDGSVKISDAPSGSRITATWSSPNMLVFEILGVTPASGATVRFATIQRNGFAHSTDEVSLAAGDADAVVATAFVPSGDSSGGVPDAPVIVSACDTIDVELVSGAFGPSEVTSRGGDRERTSRCTYESASGIRLDLSVQRRSNPRSDAFGAFRDSYEAASETRSINWGVEGELRVLEERDSSAAALLVYVHDSDPVGREIYVRIDATGAAGQGATLAAAIEPFGELLRDAILEAQP